MTDLCDVCAGTGRPVSGKPCICGGTGNSADEKVGLRRELNKANKLLDECEEGLKVAEEGLEEIREVYANMEGFIPETAPESYQQKIIEDMYECTKALLQIKKLREG